MVPVSHSRLNSDITEVLWWSPKVRYNVVLLWILSIEYSDNVCDLFIFNVTVLPHGTNFNRLFTVLCDRLSLYCSDFFFWCMKYYAGRTGVLIACYLVYTNRCDPDIAIHYIRRKRFVDFQFACVRVDIYFLC